VGTAVVSTALLLTTPPALAQPADIRTATAASRTDTSLRPLLRDVVAAGIPGVVVRVQQGDRVRTLAAGVSDITTGAALRPTAQFRAGSITKSFVATLALQLVEEGKLSLDQPVERHLPGLLTDGNSITVRQLLQHTSGLTDYTADAEVLTGIMENRVFTPRELVRIAQTSPPSNPPGAAFGYSNTNYIVAGLLVEAVTGHHLARELRLRIIDPLHLTNTSFPVTSTLIGGYHARGYVPTELVPTPDDRPTDVTGLNPSAAWAAGALVSDTADLSHFYRALMSGQLLGPRMLRQMTTTVAEEPTEPNTFRYGLGIERVQDPCGANWGHTGAVFGYQSLAYFNEQTHRTVVLASTMFPPPTAAQEALEKLTNVALC
jgi:D-alanyl-D-alanine carboxypeptidase